MLIGGLACRGIRLFLQWYSSVYRLPVIPEAGRCISWQVFLLVPFEVGDFRRGAFGPYGVFVDLWPSTTARPALRRPGFRARDQDRFFLLAETAGRTRTATSSVICSICRCGGRDGGPTS